VKEQERLWITVCKGVALALAALSWLVPFFIMAMLTGCAVKPRPFSRVEVHHYGTDTTPGAQAMIVSVGPQWETDSGTFSLGTGYQLTNDRGILENLYSINPDFVAWGSDGAMWHLSFDLSFDGETVGIFGMAAWEKSW